MHKVRLHLLMMQITFLICFIDGQRMNNSFVVPLLDCAAVRMEEDRQGCRNEAEAHPYSAIPYARTGNVRRVLYT